MFSVIRCSVIQLCLTLRCQASLSFTISWRLFKLMSTESVILSNHLGLCLPLFSCPQSFPASGSFLMNWLYTSSVQSTGASASASVLTMNIQGWFPLGLTSLISLQFKGLSRVLSNTTVQKHHFFGTHLFMVQFSHPYMTTGKNKT